MAETFRYRLSDGTEREVRPRWPTDDNPHVVSVGVFQDGEAVHSRFITQEDVLHAYLAGVSGRSDAVPSKRAWSVEEDVENGVVRGVPIPETLRQYRPFLTELREWLQSRSEKGKRPSPTALTRTFKKLEAWGPARATAALKHSADNDYQGVYEEGRSSKATASSPQRHDHSDTNAARLRERLGK